MIPQVACPGRSHWLQLFCPNHGMVVEGRRLGRPRTAPTFILQSSSHPPPAGGGGDRGDNDGDGGNKLGG